MNSVINKPMDQLKKLDSEFDIAQTARPQFDLKLDVITGNVFGDALSHALNLFNKVGTAGTGPDLGCN